MTEPQPGSGTRIGATPARGVGPPNASPSRSTDTLLRVEDLWVVFRRPRSIRDQLAGRPAPGFPAVRGVSLGIGRGETLALVGESGSGKTTTGRADPAAGASGIGQHRVRRHRCARGWAGRAATAPERVQIVFQDPYSSLNPRITVASTIMEVLTVHRIGATDGDRRERVASLLRDVGLGPEHRPALSP